jgi:hypothetical protein
MKLQLAVLAAVLMFGAGGSKAEPACHSHQKCHQVCTSVISGYDSTGRPIYVTNCHQVCETVCD